MSFLFDEVGRGAGSWHIGAKEFTQRDVVIALGFIPTTIMDVEQPPAVQGSEPPQWVRSRQYTGRVVTGTNDEVVDEAVYNDTRHFPYLWEEITLPIRYSEDRRRAEQILLDAARRHSVAAEDMPPPRCPPCSGVRGADLGPRVYLASARQLAELTARFVTG